VEQIQVSRIILQNVIIPNQNLKNSDDVLNLLRKSMVKIKSTWFQLWIHLFILIIKTIYKKGFISES
jgi:hypothetical protein